MWDCLKIREEEEEIEGRWEKTTEAKFGKCGQFAQPYYLTYCITSIFVFRTTSTNTSNLCFSRREILQAIKSFVSLRDLEIKLIEIKNGMALIIKQFLCT